MPSASHPQAQFVPLSPALDLRNLVDSTDNFDWVTRVPREMLEEHSVQSLEQLVLLHVVIGGKPLILENWGSQLPPWLFGVPWLEENHGKKAERVRDVATATDIPMTIGHYLRSLEQLTNQFTPQNFRDPKHQRLYMKDIDTPPAWTDHLRQTLPEAFFYLNDCIEARSGGDGAIREPNEYGQMRFGKGVAPAGDLMSSLPEDMRAENMMCYIGHEGTYTPAHREMCASLGHNIMVEGSSNKKGDKAGSSIWFMTETKEREVVSEYFLSMLGHDIEVEKHFAQVNAWKKAPFNVWVVEQKVGDLILIPPLAPHQVWNRGTRTIKAAWNRTTVDTLELAIHEALPRARLVCRDEQYKNKAIIYYTLHKYYDLLQRDTVEPKMWQYGRIKQLLDDFKRLFALYAVVLINELFSTTRPRERNVERLEFDSNVTCSYCRCNIFNRFLTCEKCIERAEGGLEDTYDVCMECYAMGRSCACISKLKWVEQWAEDDLAENYEKWRQIVMEYDGDFDSETSPQPLEVARERYGKKTAAEVCQEQLAIRPFHDIHEAAPSPPASDEEPEVDDEGRVKKSKKTSRGKNRPQSGKTKSCHICFHRDWNWKLAFCTTCNNAYCYGVLYRAFDLMPQTVMENRDWKCPKCLKICSCSKCRKNPAQQAYAPKGTLLGHDTRKVADFRSVESLVDFSKTNLTWLREDNDMDPKSSNRMRKLKEKAEAEKAKEDAIGETYLPPESLEDQQMVQRVDGEDEDPNNQEHTRQPHFEIDPSLMRVTEAGNDQHMELDSTDRLGQDHARINSSRSLPQDERAIEADKLRETSSHDAPGDLSMDEKEPEERAQLASRLLAPVAQMSLAHNMSYPDPGEEAQTRMVGMGYYQQDNNPVDRILYNAPEPETRDLALPSATPQQSEFLKALLQDNSRKRRRYDEDGNPIDTEDQEFFASKKQKRAAESRVKRELASGNHSSTKNGAGQNGGTLEAPATTDREPDSQSILQHQRPSRPTAGKREVFGDVVDVDVISTIPEQDLIVPANAASRHSHGRQSGLKSIHALEDLGSAQPEEEVVKRRPGRPPRQSLPNMVSNIDTNVTREGAAVGALEPDPPATDSSRRRRTLPVKSSTNPVSHDTDSNDDEEARDSRRPQREASSNALPQTLNGRATRGARRSEMSYGDESASPEPAARRRHRSQSAHVATDANPAISQIASGHDLSAPGHRKRGRPRKSESKGHTSEIAQSDGNLDLNVHESFQSINSRRTSSRYKDRSSLALQDPNTFKVQARVPSQSSIGATLPLTNNNVEQPPRLLSLKEKLALKGKVGRIAGSAKSKSQSVGTPATSTRLGKSGPGSSAKRGSAAPKESSAALRLSSPSDGDSEARQDIWRVDKVSSTRNSIGKASKLRKSHTHSASIDTPAAKKGPTVVRLDYDTGDEDDL